MHDDSLRSRLEALNRAPLPGAVAIATNRTGAAPPASPTPAIPVAEITSRTSSTRELYPIPGLLHRGDVVKTTCGEHLRIRLPLEALWPDGTRLVAARQEHLRAQHAVAQQAVEPAVVMHAEFAALVAALPDRTLLLDLETCGLAGAALFLVGLLRQIDGALTVELLMARNYAEEAAVLESLWHILGDHDVLVTFNGKTFDWPMVLERSTRHRLRPVVDAKPATSRRLGGRDQSSIAVGSQATKLVHVDILHHARRRYRRQLPDCRLQTLERLVCRRQRGDDIPGHRIPAAYAEYVRTGFEREMDAVLHHNALDLVTLFDLSLRLAG